MDARTDTSSRAMRRHPAPSRCLTVQVVADADGAVTLRAAGNLDIYTIARLRERMARHDPGTGRVVLDMSGVTLIDSSGLGTLLSFANRARRGGACLGLVCTPELAEVLAIARLAEAFDLTLVAPDTGGASP